MPLFVGVHHRLILYGVLEMLDEPRRVWVEGPLKSLEDLLLVPELQAADRGTALQIVIVQIVFVRFRASSPALVRTMTDE